MKGMKAQDTQLELVKQKEVNKGDAVGKRKKTGSGSHTCPGYKGNTNEVNHDAGSGSFEPKSGSTLPEVNMHVWSAEEYAQYDTYLIEKWSVFELTHLDHGYLSITSKTKIPSLSALARRVHKFMVDLTIIRFPIMSRVNLTMLRCRAKIVLQSQEQSSLVHMGLRQT
ncbi:unnamed protein product [Arabis nemorensis]|uniref:Uncharacterized protein n=1 Tax=Arabis nemorensis TaxID=586526 RepID=A0A565BMS3_9BRAS|nr:unnamed protein product [Arabis nemorensis]